MKLQRPFLTSLASTTLFADETLAVGEIGCVCVAVWRGAVTPTTFERQRANLEIIVNRHPEGSGFLCVIEPTAKPPDEALRKASVEMVASHKGKLRCNAVAVEGSGFAAAITRGVISGMTLLYRHDTPAKAFATVAEAATWMGTLLQELPSERMMVQGVTEIRARIGPASRAR